MKYEFVVNGGISLILMPESDLEKSILKSLSAQTNQFLETSKMNSIGAQYVDGSIVIKKDAIKTETVQRMPANDPDLEKSGK